MIVKVLDKVENYEEAIKISCDLLKERNSVNDNYYGAILEKVSEFGAYFCMAPKFAMPHARPEDGALENDLCLLKLNEPVDFLGNEIELFLTLSAKDSSSHLELMKRVASICMDQQKFDTILNLNNEEAIMAIV